jgi:hypothetical protein
LGLGFGVTVYINAWNELDAIDAGDDQLINNSTTAGLPAFSLGTYYYTKKYFIDISLPLFLSQKCLISPKTGQNTKSELVKIR